MSAKPEDITNSSTVTLESTDYPSTPYSADLHDTHWYRFPAAIGCPCCEATNTKPSAPAHPRPHKALSRSRASDWDPFGGYPACQFSLYIDQQENDDHVHNPDPIRDAQSRSPLRRVSHAVTHMNRRILAGIIALMCLSVISVVLYLVVPAHTQSDHDTTGSVNDT